MNKRRTFDSNSATHAFVFSLMLFWLAACGGVESAQDVSNAVATNAAKTGGKGEAVITISEGDETTLEADAMYIMPSNAESAGPLLSIYSYQSDTDFIAINIINTKGETKPGTHTIGDGSDFKISVTRNVAGVQSVGGPNAGQLGIYTSTDSSINGSFLLYVEMTGGTGSDRATNYAVHGTFAAVKGQHKDLPSALR